MKLKMNRRVIGAAVVVAALFYGSLVFYATKAALFPQWYLASVAHELKILPACSTYQKNAYLYCGNPQSDLNLDYEDVVFERATRGKKIDVRGWKIRAEGFHSKGIVLLVHGAGADRRAMLKHVPYLRRAGFETILIDCHNHGLSSYDGKGISYGLWESESILAVTEEVSKKDHRPIILMGTSLGAVAALRAASLSSNIKAIVAENPFYSLRRIFSEVPIMGWIPSSVRVGSVLALSLWHGFDFDNINAFVYGRDVKAPVLLIHGVEDKLVSYRHSQDILNEIRTTKDFWLVPGGSHEVLWNQMREDYEKKVLDFLDRYAASSD